MRTFKLIGALALVLAFSAISVASASAEETLWRWLPGSAKETFTGKSGSATLELDKQKPPITCTGSTTLLTIAGIGSSELIENEAKLALALIHFVGCKAGGLLPVNSLSDEKEVILVHVELHNCMIKAGDFGILFKPLPVHLEIPSLSLLILVEGSFVGRIKPLVGDKKHYELEIKQAGGLQAIEKCEGAAEKENLICSDNGLPFVECGEEATAGLLLFDGTIDKNGEEMMEK